MMAGRSANRSMFWRVLGRLLFANRARLAVVLLALGAGSAVTAALLNLRVDARRRLASEFRSFGANVVVAPRAGSAPALLSESVFDRVPDRAESGAVAKAEFLYGLVEVSAEGTPARLRAVLAGYAHAAARPGELLPRALLDAETGAGRARCGVGSRLAARLALAGSPKLALANGPRSATCSAAPLPSTGGAEDDQVFLDLAASQKLLEEPGRISLIQLSVPGRPPEIQRFLAALGPVLGDAQARPVRQLTEGEALLYGKVSGILDGTVAVVLLLTALCVMAAMTNAAMERRNDVGLMKAIGGSVRRVLRLFLAEAALLGLAGGLLGAAAGLALARTLGSRVFGVPSELRLIVYPVSVALSVIVAVLAAYPLRRLARVRPASVFRGEP